MHTRFPITHGGPWCRSRDPLNQMDVKYLQPQVLILCFVLFYFSFLLPFLTLAANISEAMLLSLTRDDLRDIFPGPEHFLRRKIIYLSFHGDQVSV